MIVEEGRSLCVRSTKVVLSSATEVDAEAKVEAEAEVEVEAGVVALAVTLE